MKASALLNALEKHDGSSRDGDLVKLANSDLTVFASIGDTTLTLERISQIELSDDYAKIRTRDHSYVVALEDIRALRFGSSGARSVGLR